MDSIKDIVWSSMKVPEFDKHMMKAGGHIGRNVVEITIKMKTMVWKPLMIRLGYVCGSLYYHLSKIILAKFRARPKCCSVFFDKKKKGVVHHKYAFEGQTVNEQYYWDVFIIKHSIHRSVADSLRQCICILCPTRIAVFRKIQDCACAHFMFIKPSSLQLKIHLKSKRVEDLES